MFLRKTFNRIIAFILILLVFAGLVLFFLDKVNNSTGSATQSGTISIGSGDSGFDVAEKLSKEGYIQGEIYFVFYLWREDLFKKVQAGDYGLNPNMKIPEIATMITEGRTKPSYVKITFPEGWSAALMAERLTANGLDGTSFLKIVNNPPDDILSTYTFLGELSKSATLEGYLFPDTYFFSVDSDGKEIATKMLENFEDRFGSEIAIAAKNEGKTIHELVTMASIIEGEVKTNRDRKIVSGIFWNRIEIGMRLQSDATVAYVLEGGRKEKHNLDDIGIDSPYNTYKYNGLPPGPIGNPGIVSLEAAVSPDQTDYLYFLNNTKTGETFFAETFEEHVQNKHANGL